MHDGLIALWIALLLFTMPAPVFLYSRWRMIRTATRRQQPAWRILWQVEMPRLFGAGHPFLSWALVSVCFLVALSLVALPLYTIAIAGGCTAA
jgi:hypothetical protein